MARDAPWRTGAARFRRQEATTGRWADRDSVIVSPRAVWCFHLDPSCRRPSARSGRKSAVSIGEWAASDAKGPGRDPGPFVQFGSYFSMKLALAEEPSWVVIVTFQQVPAFFGVAQFWMN